MGAGRCAEVRPGLRPAAWEGAYRPSLFIKAKQHSSVKFGSGGKLPRPEDVSVKVPEKLAFSAGVHLSFPLGTQMSP